jgi:lipopolysaccharide/colanic/teichoic acid biosynthesis glycosyltransferase
LTSKYDWEHVTDAYLEIIKKLSCKTSKKRLWISNLIKSGLNFLVFIGLFIFIVWWLMPLIALFIAEEDIGLGKVAGEARHHIDKLVNNSNIPNEIKGSKYLHSSLKRGLDITIAIFVLLISLPFYIWMYFENKKRNVPLLFKQKRMGREGRAFDIIKFETLYPGAENEPETFKMMHSANKEKDDYRIPNALMKLIRSTGLNELPQVVNILRGEMSIVGPRPQVFYYLNTAKEIFPDIFRIWKATSLTISPGLLGVSPLKTRSLPVEQFKTTAYADIEYFMNATLWRDFKIIIESILSILKINLNSLIEFEFVTLKITYLF